MLELKIPAIELWDEQKQEFISREEQTLQLEHSLVSLSEWESKWHKAFLSKNEKTEDEVMDYIRCMTVTDNVDPDIYKYLTMDNIKEVERYINESMTATVFSDDKTSKNSRDVITAELIYHWMIALQIPIEFQHWHLNRLITQIRVCNVKNQPPKKMSKRDILNRNRALNEARRNKMNSKG